MKKSKSDDALRLTSSAYKSSTYGHMLAQRVDLGVRYSCGIFEDSDTNGFPRIPVQDGSQDVVQFPSHHQLEISSVVSIDICLNHKIVMSVYRKKFPTFPQLD